MKTYDWILFDADETLFHFDAFRGLQQMFSALGVQFTEHDYGQYQDVNKPLWVAYQNGSITAQQVQHRRFNLWADRLGITAAELSDAFLAKMAEICTPLEGAVSLLNALRGKAKLGIITNGFTQMQQTRLERTGLQDHFEILVISEQVGAAKPHSDIFEHALAAMGNPKRDKVLMVGDNPDADILGGINAGFDTCWLNVENKPVPDNITPKYQVSSLSKLETLLLGEQN